MTPVDPAALAVLAAAMYPAHLLADHPLQPSAWAAAKGGCARTGRVACAKHTAVVTLLQGGFALAVAALTGLDINPLAFTTGLAFTAWSHYWMDRRFTAAGLYEAMGMTRFARLGAPRPGYDDAPHLGTGAYRMDQDWHTLWVLLAALVMASTGLLLTVLASVAVMVMVLAIVASRVGRARLATPAP